MARTQYEIQSSSSGSYTTYGFWLEERPMLKMPTPAYDSRLVSIPYSDKQLDFSRMGGSLHYSNGRDFEFKFRKVKPTSDEHDIVTDVNSFYAWLVSLVNVSITDTWNNRTFDNCTITGVDVEYPNNMGWESIVTATFHSVNAKDTNGVL